MKSIQFYILLFLGCTLFSCSEERIFLEEGMHESVKIGFLCAADFAGYELKFVSGPVTANVIARYDEIPENPKAAGIQRTRYHKCKNGKYPKSRIDFRPNLRGKYIEGVAAHELLHHFGFEHSDDTNSIMHEKIVITRPIQTYNEFKPK